MTEQILLNYTCKKNAGEFLGNLTNCEHNFDIIILTETRAKDDTQTQCHIPGSESRHNYRSERRGGGVSIFVNKSHRLDVTET